MITGDIERVREALRFIPADDRETWIKVGMAVKSGWGDAGFDAWDAWSQQADSYSARDARDVWKSISGNGKVTAGTLFHEAKARGWSGVPTSEEHANVAQKAAAIWKASTPAPDDHPYLVRKGIKAHGLRLYKGALVAPMRADAELHSLQFIRADGTKRFLKGGRVAGCYCNIGDANGAAALCIGEGFATAASIYEATGLPVAVSFNAGNLEPVAKSLRAKFPNVSVIVCADDDIRTEGNPGITKATTAARSVGGKVAIPDFGVDRPDGATDFNDLAEHRGLQAVERAIANASAPARGEVQASGESAPVADPANANAWPDPLPLPIPCRFRVCRVSPRFRSRSCLTLSGLGYPMQPSGQGLPRTSRRLPQWWPLVHLSDARSAFDSRRATTGRSTRTYGARWLACLRRSRARRCAMPWHRSNACKSRPTANIAERRCAMSRSVKS